MEGKDGESGGVARVGMVWGGIGGVVGFFVSLLGSLAGVIAAAFVGFYCGRRAADAGKKGGAVSGLAGGAISAPGFVMGAAAGALVSAQQIGSSQMASSLSEIMGTRISADEAWSFFLLGTGFAALIQIAVLLGAAATAGALTARKRS